MHGYTAPSPPVQPPGPCKGAIARGRWQPCASAARGFTLVELLVALALMALMAAMSWRGLDSMTHAQQRLTQHADAVLTLQTGLAQWGADLDAMALQPNTPSMDWDGRALRLLRRGSQSSSEGLHVVAWSQRRVGDSGDWLRWQSPPLTTRAALQAAWRQAAQWAQNPSDADRLGEVRISPLVGWQIFYFRGGAWTNPLSSAEGSTAAGSAAELPKSPSTASSGPTALVRTSTGTGNASDFAGTANPPVPNPATPDGVRLLLTLAPDQAISGLLTRDWSRPGLGAAP